ncbi:reverse transcriptase domain-containing protein [Tanacetum coccineum]
MVKKARRFEVVVWYCLGDTGYKFWEVATLVPQCDSLDVPMFQQGEDPIECINKAMAFLSAVASRNQATIQDGRVTVQQVQGRQNQSYAGTGNRGIATTSKGNVAASQPREKLMLAKAQEAGQILDEEQLAFLADFGISEAPVAQQTIPQNSAFQTDDLDAYDSDCDDLSSAKAIPMANLSSCDPEVLFEIHSGSNIIPYSQYLQESQDAVIQDTNHSAPNDLFVLSLVEQMTDHVAHLDKEMSKEKESKYIEKEIVLEKQNKELENIICKMYRSTQAMHMLTKPQVFYDNTHKQALRYQNSFHLKKAQRIQPTLYDGSVIAKEHAVISVIGDEETLILKKSRSKMLDKQNDLISIEKKIKISPIDYSKLNKVKDDFRKRFVTKKELSVAFWLKHSSLSETPVTSHTPVRIEAHSELPKSVENSDLNAQLQAKNNRDAHEVYIEKTIEYTDTLREFEESARTQNPSEPLLESACMFTKHVQELFVEPVTSSSNIPKQTDSFKTKDSNKPLLTSTRVKLTTSASGSKPLGDTKNIRITRPPHSNQKNKVEDHTRKVKSSLNKTNSVSEPINNALVKNSVRNAKFESICAIYNKCTDKAKTARKRAVEKLFEHCCFCLAKAHSADHVVAPTLGSAITIPETANEFAIKGNHLTLVKGNQFDGRTKTDPHKHIHKFLGICDMFNYKDTENEAVRLMMFPLSLTGEAKTWLDELNEGTIKIWDELRTTFISRFFPPALFDRLLREIRAFSQHENESLTDAWLRMKEMLRNCHGHYMSKGNIIKIFYHGLSEITQEVLNAAAGGIFLYKTPNQAYQLLEDKVLLKLDWAKNQKTKTSLKKIVAFADEGSSNSNTFLTILCPNGCHVMKMDAMYNDSKNHAKKTILDEDDVPKYERKKLNSCKLFQSTNAFVKETFIDLKTQLETVAKNHQASIQNLETKFDRLADKQFGRPSGSLLSNTQPNPKGHNSKAYQPPQSRNEHVNVVFTRSGKSYNPPVNQNDQQNNSETLVNFDSDDEDKEPTP